MVTSPLIAALSAHCVVMLGTNARSFRTTAAYLHQHTQLKLVPSHPDTWPVSLRRLCRRLHHGCGVYVREVHARSPRRYRRRHFGCVPSCRCAGGSRPLQVRAVGIRTDIGRGECCQARAGEDQIAFGTLKRGPDTQNHRRVMANHHSGRYALLSPARTHAFGMMILHEKFHTACMRGNIHRTYLLQALFSAIVARCFIFGCPMFLCR